MHEGRPAAFDAVIPRIGHSITRHGVAVLRHLEQMGSGLQIPVKVYFRVAINCMHHNFLLVTKSRSHVPFTSVTPQILSMLSKPLEDSQWLSK
jgi:glutathione synthase/RimK-type ligase-like ATP-grasp enzyme